jgi:hypothetical protein
VCGRANSECRKSTKVILNLVGFEMTLNYWMIVGRYLNPNGVVGDVIPGCETFSLLDAKLVKCPNASYGLKM